MPLTVIVTRDVEERYRGFLGSAMLEVSPGTYVSPNMSAGVRERVWAVMCEWHQALGRGSITLVWRDKKSVGNLRIENLGEPPKTIIDADGILLVKRK